eukprot:GHVU01231470.1.p1 GENE.GHVU01231470.1~~GHVU01231470.1.p1  ORF type:complete len:184 (+),score=10.21 GHVU01231470.1:78-629(+)
MQACRVLRSAVAAPLKKNVTFEAVIPLQRYLEQPNMLRQPLWKTFWEAQFNSRTFLFFGKSWMTFASLGLFLWWTRLFDPAPMERLDRYWLNSPQFRILSAFHNQGKRPAFSISLLTHDIRYFFRGIDHPFGLNEYKDMLFKLRENYLIEKHPGIQYPYVFRQFRAVKTPDTLEVHTYPLPNN